MIFYYTKIILQNAKVNTTCMVQKHSQRNILYHIHGTWKICKTEKNYNPLRGKILAIASCAECTCSFS
jgi:hypothetical protein